MRALNTDCIQLNMDPDYAMNNFKNKVPRVFKIIIPFLMSYSLCFAQNGINISSPKIEMKDSLVHIFYHILNAPEEDKFVIRLEISDPEGKLINPRFINGDIGESISGGRDKKITWDVYADSIFINDDIYFTLYANRIIPPEPDPVPLEEAMVEQEVENVSDSMEENTSNALQPNEIDNNEELTVLDIPSADKIPYESNLINKDSKTFNRTGLIIQSIPLPGLGLSRYKGKPHWLRGIAGYGSVAGSIVFLRKSNSSYTEFNNAVREDWQHYYLGVAQWQENIAFSFAAAALGIWVIDQVWTIAGTSELKKGLLSNDSGGIGIRPDFDHCTHSPMLTLSFRFR